MKTPVIWMRFECPLMVHVLKLNSHREILLGRNNPADYILRGDLGTIRSDQIISLNPMVEFCAFVLDREGPVDYFSHNMRCSAPLWNSDKKKALTR